MDNLLYDFIQHINEHPPMDASELPNIDLYMDQVTTFMDEHLSSSKRYPQDKILTKTMINNYAKNRLLPPPDKKKYSKDHMLLLIFIYYFKNILSISDIQKLLAPISDRYFKGEDGRDMTWLYSRIMEQEPAEAKRMVSELEELFETAKQMFPDSPQQDQKDLQLFSIISLLSYDIYIKKQLIEKLIDSCTPAEGDISAKNSSVKKKK
jgi:hypothetical protein